MQIIYSPKFIRQFNKLPSDLQEEVLEKVELFKNVNNHKILKVHKLGGRLRKYHGFWIDFHNRVVFDYMSGDKVAFLSVGDHEIYRQKDL